MFLLSILLSSDLSPQHRNLPSFPTRRSSDLGRRLICVHRWRARVCRCFSTSTPVWPTSPPRFATWDAASAIRRRSEEHTSELQSLRHLVCRLLLEKKRKKEQSGRYENAV